MCPVGCLAVELARLVLYVACPAGDLGTRGIESVLAPLLHRHRHLWSRHGCSSSEVISGHQWSSVVISGHQWSSVVTPWMFIISGHQLLSVVINKKGIRKAHDDT